MDVSFTGPIAVIFEKMEEDKGALYVAVASLSASNACDVETSALVLNLCTIPNCTRPLNPLSVSKSSSRAAVEIRYFPSTEPPNHSNASSFA